MPPVPAAQKPTRNRQYKCFLLACAATCQLNPTSLDIAHIAEMRAALLTLALLAIALGAHANADGAAQNLDYDHSRGLL